MHERVATHCKRRLNKYAHVSHQNITAKRQIIFTKKDYRLDYILKHYGVNSGFMRKKVMNSSFPGHAPGKDTLRAANAATKVGVTGRKQNKRSEFCCLPVVPRKWGLTGEKTTERASCEVRLLSSRLNLSSCLNFVPALPERVARRENGLCLLSLRQNNNPSFPGHAPGKDTLRAANAATKVGANGGENNRTSFLRSKVVCSPVPYLAIIVFTSNAPNSSSFPVSPMMFSSISATYSLRPASEGCSFRVQRLALPPLS